MTPRSESPTSSFIAFQGHTCLARGTLPSVQRACRSALARDAQSRLLVFDLATSEQIELDLRPAPASATGPGPAPAASAPSGQAPAPVAPTVAPERSGGPGRPRLGVVAREVTLLPRHWEWLSAQPGGASVALRRLVDQARQQNQGRDRVRQAQESCYRFLQAIAGDLPGFEEATRALFAGDGARLRAQIADWPADLQAHALALAEPAIEQRWDEGRRHA